METNEPDPDLPHASEEGRCMNAISAPILFFDLVVVLIGSKLIKPLFKYVGLHAILPEAVAGVCMGIWENAGAGPSFPGVIRLFRTVSYAGMMTYTFVLGLEMDPRSLFQTPDRAAIIAYSGIMGSVLAFIPLYDRMRLEKLGVFGGGDPLQVAVVAALLVSNTASPVLTRLITDLKIGKTEVGRFAVSVGVFNDMLTTSGLAFVAAFGPFLTIAEPRNFSRLGIIYVAIMLGAEFLFIVKVIPIFTNWINRKNPEGKPMKPSHLLVSSAIAAILCMLPAFIGFSGILCSFTVGLFYPRDGRLSRQMVHKANIILDILVFPILFGWIGFETMYRIMRPTTRITVRVAAEKIALFTAAGTVGKVLGTGIAAVCLRFHVLEAIALGLLLSAKGHFHIYYSILATVSNIITPESYPEVVISFLFSVMCIPMAVKIIIMRSRHRKASVMRPITLQMHDPMSELRMMVCLHGTHNIPAFINIIEASRGDPVARLLTVFAMDLVHLTQRTAATLTYGAGLDAVAVTEESVMRMREEITEAVEAYVEESGEGLVVRRLLAISSYENMHEDICNAAADALAVMIILPFHKTQRIDGGMDESNKFKIVNRRVLQRAPCSVGILVDRGLGGTSQLTAAYSSHQVAVIFIGGRDDREALAYAARMARHPGIKLTAIRFLVDPNITDACSSVGASGRLLTDIENLEKEMSLDDQCFAAFHQRNVVNGPVAYIEKYAMNGAETVSTLRSLEELYSLFIVGRGSAGSSVLTAGMSDWEENPELGPIGDTLASLDFSTTISVLIVKQHNPNKDDPEEWDDEFSIM